VASLPKDAIVLVGTYQRDSTGREFTPRDVVARIAKESSVPIYATVESYVGIGVVGGHVLSPAADGEKAGRLALRVLSGDHPGPPVAGASIHMFDWRQLQRWGLDENRVPAGSAIRFRQPSVWETYRWYVVAVVLIVVAQSALIAALLVERRQRRQAEAARRQALEQARRAREDLAHTLRVATLGELVAAIAHEMNQPLTAIMTNAEATRRMVDDGSATSTEPVEALADIKAAAVRASQIIQRLRAMARKGPVESREIDLDKLIDETVALLRGDIALKRITILVEPAKDLLPRVNGDPIQLQQVLLNLIVNAEDAIATAGDGAREIVVETTLDEPGFVHLTVRDTGGGVEEAALEEIFQPFVTTKGGGLGMGLSISRSIVEAHHGRIWATRQWPRGTSLHVMLPVAPR
jgi:C4-dicarboxylate-specific signal transduction histidine kinase